MPAEGFAWLVVVTIGAGWAEVDRAVSVQEED